MNRDICEIFTKIIKSDNSDIDKIIKLLLNSKYSSQLENKEYVNNVIKILDEYQLNSTKKIFVNFIEREKLNLRYTMMIDYDLRTKYKTKNSIGRILFGVQDMMLTIMEYL